MSWVGVAGAVVGGVVSYKNAKDAKKAAGGAGTDTQSKEPWEEAIPWIKNNMAQGQALQQQYMDQPFNPQQQQAYANQYALSDYVRGQVPQLLTQMQGNQLGYDPNKGFDTSGIKAFDWGLQGDGSTAAGGLLGGGGAGLLGGSMTAAQGQADAAAKARADAAAAAEAERLKNAYKGEFINQNDVLNGLNFTGHGNAGALLGTGRFGQFQYGNTYDPGTQGYRDMSEYFNYGGADPNNLYGRGKTPWDFSMLQAGTSSGGGGSSSGGVGGGDY